MLSMKQQKFMLELLVKKQLRPNQVFKSKCQYAHADNGIFNCECCNFCNDSDLFHQIKKLIDNKYVNRIKDKHDTIYELTLKGLLFTKILALNEKRYCSCLKKEYIEFILEPDGST